MRNITIYTNQKVRLNLAKTSFVDHLLSCTDCSQKRSLHSSWILQTLVHSVLDWYVTWNLPILIIIRHLSFTLFMFILSLFAGKNPHSWGVTCDLILFISDHSNWLDYLYFLLFLFFHLIKSSLHKYNCLSFSGIVRVWAFNTCFGC